MIGKVMNILETIGALVLVVAFCLWRGEWWKESNMLFWGAIALFTPVIIWKAWKKSNAEKLMIAICYIALIVIGLWWFGKKDLKVKVPFLPEITIHRS